MKKTLLFVLAAIFACYTMNAQQILFSDGFEEGLAAWTTIDDDGDGFVWDTASVGYQPNSGSFSIISGSYDNNVGPLTPDNWLITATPITLGASCAISWWDAAQDASYPAEHYAVYVSTGNTVSDFTAGSAVFETTLNSNTWNNRMVDLTSYAGQTVYVAFRHFNCTDQFYLKLDDVQVIENITVPEITLSRLTVPATVDVNTPFTMSGVVTNPSTVALTSFKVSYTLDGENSGDITISGINVPLGGTYAFSHTAPAFVTTGGLHTFSITVSEPNGTADITADNTLNGTFLACGVAISSFPYEELFEDGTLGCWQTYDEDGDGDAFEYTNAGIGVAYSQSYMVTDIDNWLITPAIQIPETGTYYAMWADFCYDANNPDKYSYYIGTSPSVSAYASATPIETVTSDTAVNQRYVSLAEYAGQTIYMAFRHHDCAAGYIIIGGYTVMDPNAVLDTIEVVSANETMGTVTGGGVFEDGTEITISATPNAGYRFVRWNDNNTDNPRTIVCEGNATYTAYFELIPTTGINDVNAADVKLFPNPTSGNLYVEVEGLQKVEIIDAVGRVVLSQNNGTVNMSNLANGIYTVRVSANGTTSIKKVVKK